MARVISTAKAVAPRRAALAEDPVDAVEVAKVAYGLFELRGQEHGHDLEDWLKAEMIVRAHTNGRAPKPRLP